MSRGRELYERAGRRIPGGTQLLSKRPERMLPGQWPPYYRRALGVEIEDLDGRRYVDVGLGSVGACPLGYADPDVEEAVVGAVRAGNMCSLNCPEEVELADLLCELHPWAAGARYTRGGGEAMALAVRLARAATGRDGVAICGYHGWHDWYLAANLGDEGALDGHLLPGLPPAGVPRGLKDTAWTFRYGDREGFDRVVDAAGDRLAAVVLEPLRKQEPPEGFLEHVRATATEKGAALVFDEITTGFRFRVGGVHADLGVEPDLAVFAKALSNGYPMAAVIGREAILRAVASTFVSSTSWSDRIGPVAALATIRKLRRLEVPQRLHEAGTRMQRAWREAAEQHGMPIEIAGRPALCTFGFVEGRDEDPHAAALLHALYTQEMLDSGFLAGPAFYAMAPHDERTLARAAESVSRVFGRLRKMQAQGVLEGQLRGPLPETGFARLA